MKFQSIAVALVSISSVAAQVFTCTGGSVYIVAHADDDLLFQSPDILHDIQGSNCVTSIYLTAGDSGLGPAYAKSREAGNEAATAAMAGVADVYTEFNATYGGQTVLVRTLQAAPRIQKVWFRLPDGGYPNGAGFSITGSQSLELLYFGAISSVTNVMGYSTFTKSTLTAAITSILVARMPNNVRTLNYLSEYDSGDHSDHHTVARSTRDIVESALPGAALSGYEGYPINNFPPNVFGSDLATKESVFFEYTQFDADECVSYSACAAAGRPETSWLNRMYNIDATNATVELANRVQHSLPVADLALFSIATTNASYAPFQSPANAIDGVISGYDGNGGDSRKEWATNGGGVGVTLLLTWTQPFSINSVVLFDRPNLNDQITGGTLLFDDGTIITVPSLNNDGTATNVSFPTLVSSTLLFTVTSISSSTGSVGLAEIEVFGPGTTIIPAVTLAKTAPLTLLPQAGPVANSTGFNVTATLGNLTIVPVYNASVALSNISAVPVNPIVTNSSALAAALTSIILANSSVSSNITANGTATSALPSATVSQITTNTSSTISAALASGTVSSSSANLTTSTNSTSFSATASIPTSATISASSSSTSAAAISTNTSVVSISGSTVSSSIALATSSASSILSTVSAASQVLSVSSNITTSGTTTSTPLSTNIPQITANASPTSTATLASGTISSSAANLTSSRNSTSLAATASISSAVITSAPTSSTLLIVATSANVSTSVSSTRAAASSTSNALPTSSASPISSTASSSSQVLPATASTSAAVLAASTSRVVVSSIAVSSTVTPSLTSSTTSNVATSTKSVPVIVVAATPSSTLSVSSSSTVSSIASSTVSTASLASSTSSTAPLASSTSTWPTYPMNAPFAYFVGDIARVANVTASSFQPGSPPVKSLNGIMTGFPEVVGNEWISQGEGAGASITLSWNKYYYVNVVSLWDRPNANDCVKGGLLTFSDGSTVIFGAVGNNGMTPKAINWFGKKYTNSVKVTITSVSAQTVNIGFAEVQVFTDGSSSISGTLNV